MGQYNMSTAGAGSSSTTAIKGPFSMRPEERRQPSFLMIY